MKLKQALSISIVAVTVSLVCAFTPICAIKISNADSPWEMSGRDLVLNSSISDGNEWIRIARFTCYVDENNHLVKSDNIDGQRINSHGIKVENDNVLNIDDYYTEIEKINDIVLGIKDPVVRLSYNGGNSKESGIPFSKIYKTDIKDKNIMKLSVIGDLYNTTINLSDNLIMPVRASYNGYDLFIKDGERFNNIQKENIEADKEINKLVKQAKAYKTEREQVEFIYEWLIKNIEYSSNPRATSVYDAVVNKEAVCEGIARTFYQVCRRLGIDVRYIHGTETKTGKETLHAWNAVKFKGEDNWFYFDATWDCIGYKQNGILFFGMTKGECNAYHRQECVHE